jgi:sec-independent protein translocase protein TatA
LKELHSYLLQIVGTEWIWIIFLIIFLLFGSKKLPELSRAIGKAMGELQKGREEIEREFRLASLNSPQTQRRTVESTISKSKYAKAAENMGIDSKGKSDEILRKEIMTYLNEKQKKEAENKNKQKTNRDQRPE